MHIRHVFRRLLVGVRRAVLSRRAVNTHARQLKNMVCYAALFLECAEYCGVARAVVLVMTPSLDIRRDYGKIPGTLNNLASVRKGFIYKRIENVISCNR